jgi:hypothetical protein
MLRDRFAADRCGLATWPRPIDGRGSQKVWPGRTRPGQVAIAVIVDCRKPDRSIPVARF